MQPSPYTPGELARGIPGRDPQLAEVEERLSYLLDLGRLVGRIRVDIAPRGYGKTSLLAQAQRAADERGALTLWVTAGDPHGLIASIAAELDERTADWHSGVRDRLRTALEHLTVTLGVPGVAQVAASWPAGDRASDASVRQFEATLREAVSAAEKERHRGLVLFVDEIQSADAAGLRVLATAWQHLQRKAGDLRAAVFAAGLLNTPTVIAEAVTFSERFAYRTLDPLSDAAVMIALGAPARELGVTWSDAALGTAVSIARGYPYAVQLIGDAAWTAAGRPDRGAQITARHVAAGREIMQQDMRVLHEVRWNAATAREREFLRAMATLGDEPVRRADLQAALGTDLSAHRDNLIKAGVIVPAGRGFLAFAVPDFARYIRDQHQ